MSLWETSEKGGKVFLRLNSSGAEPYMYSKSAGKGPFIIFKTNDCGNELWPLAMPRADGRQPAEILDTKTFQC
jgi:hypothetical protein